MGRGRAHWGEMLGTVAVLAVFGLVAAAWIGDVPDVPLEERADVFLLLALFVAVLVYTADGGRPRRIPSFVRLRSVLGWIRGRPAAPRGPSTPPPGASGPETRWRAAGARRQTRGSDPTPAPPPRSGCNGYTPGNRRRVAWDVNGRGLGDV